MDIISDMGEFLNQIGDIEVLVDATDYVYLDQYGIGTIAPDGYGPHSASRRRARRNKTAEITWSEASDVLYACVDKAVEYFEDMVADGEDVDDAVSEAVYGAIDDTCMYYTDQLAMIWACGGA